METEIWKPVPYYEDSYMISNLGNVKSRNTILKLQKSKNGYLRARISYIGRKEHISVHRLVASAFLGLDLDDRDTLVCHKDDNRDNNNLNNLFLGSHKDNSADMVKKGRNLGCIESLKRKIIQLDMNGVYIKHWGSVKDASDNLGIFSGNISACLKLKRKSTGGYKWEYAK